MTTPNWTVKPPSEDSSSQPKALSKASDKAPDPNNAKYFKEVADNYHKGQVYEDLIEEIGRRAKEGRYEITTPGILFEEVKKKCWRPILS